MTTEHDSRFGDLIRQRRTDLRITLRQFAADHEFEPGYLSRLERGIAPPPQSGRVLGRLADALGFEAGGEDRQEFFDLAAIQARRLPPDLAQSVVNKLPLFFRTLRNRAIDEKGLDAFIKLVEQQYRP